MKRRTWLVLALVAPCMLGCQKQQDDLQNLPGPGGLLPDGSPPRAEAPRAPNAGTYNGDPRGNPRPPQSGINADPSNPSGAPGSYSNPMTVR